MEKKILPMKNIVILGSFKDAYNNLTYKTLFGYQWTTLHCRQAQFVRITDEDMYMHIPGICKDPLRKTPMHSPPPLEVGVSVYLTSLQTHCTEVLRIGDMTDGGWNVCHVKPYRPPFPCLVYSFGINKDFSFDDLIVKTYGCDVHSFDPSIGQPDFRRGDKIWFHNLGLSGVTGKLRKWKVSTLKDIVDNLNHTSRRVNIVKMDIEFSEWTSLPNIIKTEL
ncbi:unnamed protein product [Mytilus edulis]|uniref:Methyltransferase domain-containing protein n=1 Tax=Mytilus edulis TaxID=6550 RepID=A0A8S3SZK6_MYTED|nr:unnamed protein product [Mytilus edulis]